MDCLICRRIMRCLDDWEASSRGGWVAGWKSRLFRSQETTRPPPHVIRKGAGDDCDLGALPTSLAPGPHKGWDCGFSPCLEQLLVWSLLLFGALTHSSPSWLGFPPHGPAVILSVTLCSLLPQVFIK